MQNIAYTWLELAIWSTEEYWMTWQAKVDCTVMPVLRILDQGAKSRKGKKYWRKIRVGAERKSIESGTALGGDEKTIRLCVIVCEEELQSSESPMLKRKEISNQSCGEMPDVKQKLPP